MKRRAASDVVRGGARSFAKLAESKPDQVLGFAQCANRPALDLNVGAGDAGPFRHTLEFRGHPRFSVRNFRAEEQERALQPAQPVIDAGIELDDLAMALD